MLNCYEEAKSDRRAVTDLSPGGSMTVRNLVAGAGFEPATFGL